LRHDTCIDSYKTNQEKNEAFIQRDLPWKVRINKKNIKFIRLVYNLIKKRVYFCVLNFYHVLN